MSSLSYMGTLMSMPVTLSTSWTCGEALHSFSRPRAVSPLGVRNAEGLLDAADAGAGDGADAAEIEKNVLGAVVLGLLDRRDQLFLACASSQPLRCRTATSGLSCGISW